MPRVPLYYQLHPAHNRLPSAGTALWYPLHGSLQPAIEDTPFAAEAVTGVAAVDKWTRTLFGYGFPSDNGTTNSSAIRIADISDEDDPVVDQVMSLRDLAIGAEIVVVNQMSFVEQDLSSGAIWTYGRNSAFSGYGLMMTTAEILQLFYRGADSSGSSTANFTLSGPVTLTSLKGQGLFSMAVSFRRTGAMTTDVSVALVHPSLGTSTGSVSVDWNVNGATALAGKGGTSVANYAGVTLGARQGASLDTFFGRGATNLAFLGNWAARKFAAYDAARLTDTVSSLLLRPADIPETFLEAA